MQRDVLLIAEMIDAATQAQSLVAEVDLPDLTQDRQRRDALLWNFTVLGEAASRVTGEVKQRFPDPGFSLGAAGAPAQPDRARLLVDRP